MMAEDTDERSWIGQIEQLHKEDVINAADEAALIRHMADQRERMEQALVAIAPEYKQRLERDGKESADLWLAEVAREMGQADGRASREVVDNLDASRD